jgi:hypothetical protein
MASLAYRSYHNLLQLELAIDVEQDCSYHSLMISIPVQRIMYVGTCVVGPLRRT